MAEPKIKIKKRKVGRPKKKVGKTYNQLVIEQRTSNIKDGLIDKLGFTVTDEQVLLFALHTGLNALEEEMKISLRDDE